MSCIGQSGIGHLVRAVRVRSLLAVAGIALLLTSSIVVVAPGASSSEPETVVNPDDTMSLVWSLDNASDFAPSSASIAGGAGMLERRNESVSEHSQASFDLGPVKVNVSTSVVPDAVAPDPSAAMVYSLVVQPGSEGNDTYISEDSPNNNNGGADTIRLDSEDGKTVRPLLRFDLAQLPIDAQIVNATLWLYMDSTRTPDITFDVHALNFSFVEDEVTWNRYAIGNPWTGGGEYEPLPFSEQTFDATLGWQAVDLRRLVELWVRGDIPNNGMIMVPEPTPGDAIKQFISSDDAGSPELWPKIAINYTLPGISGSFESRAIGPSTNALFTVANWTAGNVSLASDEFGGPGLGARWSWENDPSTGTGGYDVGETRPGWLRMASQTANELRVFDLEANFLRQEIVGAFSFATSFDTYFSTSPMKAGVLVLNDMSCWMWVYLCGDGGTAEVRVEIFEGHASTIAYAAPRPNTAHVDIVVTRTGDDLNITFTTDGVNWTTAGTFAPQFPLNDRLLVGLAISPGTSNANAMAEFDYARIEPVGSFSGFEVMARTGNSTVLTDPSWGLWGTPLPSMTASVLGDTGKYVQFQLSLWSSLDWAVPAFSWFQCRYERYASSGVIETLSVTVTDFSRWYTLNTEQAVSGDGVTRVDYSVSTDMGFSWSTPVASGPLSISSTEPNMKVRVRLWTNDTLETPEVRTIEAVYGAAVSDFYVQAPATVVAGSNFTVKIYAKDATNTTMIMWTGPITMHALNAEGTAPASSELEVTSAAITGGGYVNVVDESYQIAETIRIHTYSGAISGLSAPIAVLPGPVASIAITPYNTTMSEYTGRAYAATAYDEFDNVVPDAEFTWSAESSLGTLNSTAGQSVRITVGAEGSEGYLNVSSEGVIASIFITVQPVRFAPVISGTIPVQIREEDFGEWTLDLEPYVSDAEDLDSELRWYVTSENIVDVTGENRTGDLTVTLSTSSNLYGIDILQLVVVDSDGMSASAIIQVTITPVNDGPTIDQVDPLVVHYDDPYVFDFTYYVHDVDNAYVELLLSVNTASEPYAFVDGLRIRFLYPESMLWTNQTVIVTVRDPGGLTSATAVVVRVTDDNVPRQNLALPSMTLYQGTTLPYCLNLMDYFYDPDGDVLYYAYGFVHVDIEITLNSSVNITAPNSWYGVEFAIFQAIDPFGARAEGVMEVTVLPVNHPPVIAGIPDLMVRYDERYDLDLGPYVHDPDVADDLLYFSADDAHVWFTRHTMSMDYPITMNGSVNTVNITVTDGEFSDWWAVNITVSDNNPPAATELLPDHSFLEDVPVDYPVGASLADFFADAQDGQALEFQAFAMASEVRASAGPQDSGDWLVEFETDQNYFGSSELIVRAIDSEGAVVEVIVVLDIVSVADAPALSLPARYNVTEGAQSTMSLAEYLVDPDSFLSNGDFDFEVRVTEPAGAGYEFIAGITVVPGMVVFSYAKGFAAQHEASLPFEIEVRVTDQDGKMAADTMEVVVLEQAKVHTDNPWIWMAVLGTMGGSSAAVAVAWVRRKRPFEIHDLMLIHNDGFLMGRHASHVAGEIDQDVLSGMLTAVLNFVEDSMATSANGLKTFGFKEYQVLVKRGTKTFAAVVFSGDVPESIEGALEELLETVDRVYKKKLASWSGDIETDFAGLEVLIQGFVKEHSKKHLKARKGPRLWTSKKGPPGPTGK